MQHTRTLFIALCILLAANLQAHACDVCAVYTANQFQGESKPGLFFSVAEQFTHFGTLQLDSDKAPNPTGQYLDSSITQVILGYSFNDRFSVQVNLPFIHRSFKRPEGFAIDRGTETGLGDVSLLGKLLVWRNDTENSTLTFNILGGVKFPTGSTSRLEEEVNEVEIPGAPESGIHGHDLTLGTGSFDGIIGTNFYFAYKRAFFTVTVQYTFRTEGDFGYRFANDLTWDGGIGLYFLLEHAYTLALQAAVSGEHKDKDTFQGALAEDTALTSVYIGPKIIITWEDWLNADIGVDIPVSTSNTSLQITPDFRVRAAVTLRY